jgi:hypothetical protein
MEYLFLEHTFRWLVEGGVLLMKTLSTVLVRSIRFRCLLLRCLCCPRCLQRRPLGPKRDRHLNQACRRSHRPAGSGIASRTLGLQPRLPVGNYREAVQQASASWPSCLHCPAQPATGAGPKVRFLRVTAALSPECPR